MKNILTILSIILLIGGCAYRPIVNMDGKTQYQYNSDLADCNTYADQINAYGSTAVGMGIGAGIGAGLGAILGAFLGDPGGGAAMGAALGGFSGGVSGAGGAGQAKRTIIYNCMKDKGWTIYR